MLRAGIVGLPNVGKSTLFNAITRTRKAEAANYPFCTIDPNVGVVNVPDARLAHLQKIAKTGRRDPGGDRIRGHCRPGQGGEPGRGSRQQVPDAHPRGRRDCPGRRCFEDADVHHVSGTVDPVRDIEVINTELMLADLETVRKRRERVSKDLKRGDKAAAVEDAVLARLEAALDAGKTGDDSRSDAGREGGGGAVLPAHRQADDLRLQRRRDGPRDRRHQSIRASRPRLREDAPGLRGRRDQRADRERPGGPRAGRG